MAPTPPIYSLPVYTMTLRYTRYFDIYTSTTYLLTDLTQSRIIPSPLPSLPPISYLLTGLHPGSVATLYSDSHFNAPSSSSSSSAAHSLPEECIVIGPTRVPPNPPPEQKDKRPGQPAASSSSGSSGVWEDLFAHGDAMKVTPFHHAP